MSDAPPQLGEIPKASELKIPTLNTTKPQTTEHTESAPAFNTNGTAKMSGNQSTQDTMYSTKDNIVNCEVCYHISLYSFHANYYQQNYSIIYRTSLRH